MTDLEEIRRRKLEEMMVQQQEEQQIQQQVQQLEVMIKQKLTKKALERYSNIKAAHPEKAVQLLVVLGQIIQAGNNMIDDNQLKELLVRLTPKKRDFRIKKV
jgi:DNA-binding TFAR19-related protein (PDSD5 family)